MRVDDHIAHLWTFREGKAVRLAIYEEPSEALKATPEAIRLVARSVYGKAAKNSEPPPDKHSATQSIQALLKEKKLTAPCRRIGPVLNED